jgi:oligopeptide transport system substrate-binding protein
MSFGRRFLERGLSEFGSNKPKNRQKLFSKRALMVCLSLFAWVIFFSCCQRSGSTSKQVQTLRINIGADPQTLDPRKARDLNSITLMHMFFEGLTRTSKTGELEMGLAESVDISGDGLEYKFHLRKSVWSNGEPVTSYDFADSWRTILDPGFATDIAYQLYGIKNARQAKIGEISLDQVGIQTLDAETLVVELENPIPYFLQLVSMPSFFPVSQKVNAADPSWALSEKNYVGNGPFLLSQWKHSDLIFATKNPRYWQAKELKLDAIELYMMANNTEIQMFEEGKLDWAGSPLSTIPVDAISDLKKNEKLRSNPFSATYFFRVNTAERILEKKNPLSSSSFRKALAYSLNRQGITEHVLQGGQIPAKSLVPPEMGLSGKGYFYDDHQERSLSFLTDALLELDMTLENLEPIKISYSSSERNAAIAQAVQKNWEGALGIKVELEAVEPKVYFQRISQKEFQLAAGSWTADFNDPINFLEVFKYKEASTNNTNWESSKYIDLLNQSGLCRDSEERKGILREAEQILMDQMPIIPIFHFSLNYLQRESLEEVVLSPLGKIDFRWAHWKRF